MATDIIIESAANFFFLALNKRIETINPIIKIEQQQM